EHQIALRHRPAGGDRHRALNARIDRIADPQNIAEDDLGDGRDRRVLEIELVALAVAALLRRRRRLDRLLAAEIAVAARDAWRRAGRARRLGKTGRQIEIADGIEGVRRARDSLRQRHRVTGAHTAGETRDKAGPTDHHATSHARAMIDHAPAPDLRLVSL